MGYMGIHTARHKYLQAGIAKRTSFMPEKYKLRLRHPISHKQWRARVV